MTGRFLRTERDEELMIWWLDQQDDRHNKLSVAALEEIGTAIEEATTSADVRGIVVISAKPDSFIVGADLRELRAFETRADAEALSRRAHELILSVRALSIPIVAAIHGPAMGGGLELALACSMRLATDHQATTFALPEVKLGLVPGGGGTQLLPRLVGIQSSLPLLLTGTNTYPVPARRMGLVDALIHRPGLLTAAMQAARDLIAGRTKVADRGPGALHERALESTALTRRLIYGRAAERVEEKARGNYPAPPRILECVRVGMEDGLMAGLDLEAATFAELAMTPESEELVRLFFARNDAERNPFDGAQRPIRRIGILGAGLMGSGIAEVSAQHGLDVVVKDQSFELASKARKHVYRSASRRVKKGAMRPFDRDVMLERVAASAAYDAFSDVDLVIEAAPEDAGLKKRLIGDVEDVVRPSCIFASNTSSIPISDLAKASSRPDQVIGMHYFSPVPKVPLLEIIRTDRTPDWVLASAFEVGRTQGKTIIIVNDGPGFYTTRILALYMNEALDLLDDGADVQAVDHAMRDFGFPMGPYELFDLVGIDVSAKITQVLGEFFIERGIVPNHRADEMVEAGLKGRKTGRGFYVHEEGKKKEVNDAAYRFFGGSGASSPPDGDVQQRLAMALVNEAVKCLDDGILDSPVDGDVGAVFGLGFPPFRGGPFRYCDAEGPERIVERLEALEERHGTQFEPSPRLRKLVADRATFY